MAHRSPTLIAFVSGIFSACVFGEACSSGNRVDSHARELAEIEKLRWKDVEATLAGDQAALGEGMTDDVVILQQGPPMSSPAAILEGPVSDRSTLAHLSQLPRS